VAQVLVVDDDWGTLETFATILRGAGHAAILAPSGKEALRTARRPTLDLILADLRLPDIPGLDVIRRLRRDLVDAPIVIMTGFPDTESAMEAGRLGVAEYVSKPLFDDELLRVVQCHARRADREYRAPTGDCANAYAIRALDAIERGFADSSLSVRAVAEALNVSPEHLCRVIKRETGDTFGGFLARTRIREARRLLESTTLSIKQIADRVGFRTSSHFDHVFRTISGVAPHEYRIAALRSRGRTA
jgi:two-component system, response regulator YesN